jgi:calpain family cysteine protease
MPAKLVLSHPRKFKTQTLPTQSVKDASEKASHKIDNKILQAQSELVRETVKETVDLGTFCQTVEDLEKLSALHAELRADGLTSSERGRINSEFKAAGKGKPKKITPELRALYNQVKGSDLDPKEATEELNWRSLKSYGEVALDRQGKIFFEERPKLRAHLHLSRPDEKAPERKPYVHPELNTIIEKALDRFDTLDVNRDGIVNRIEARAILTDYQELGLTPAEAATLYSRQKQMAAAVDPDNSGEELKMEDLEALLIENHPKKPDEDFEDNVSLISRRYQHQLKRETPEPTPFTLGQTFQPKNVTQGMEGSCWMLCNLPALTQDQIKDVIKPEGDAYRVTLADGRTTLVEPLNAAERRVYSGGDGAWSGLLEKGLSQILAQSDEDLNAGYPRVGRKMLTGNTSKFFPLAKATGKHDFRDRDLLFDTMTEALDKGSAIFAGAVKDDFEKEISEISAANHAYTVLAVDRDNDTVTVRNPWGRSERADMDGVNDGVFDLSQDQFFANFSHLYLDENAVA